MPVFRAAGGRWTSPVLPSVSGLGRGLLVPGTYLPSASTTGVDPGLPLTDVTELLVVSSPGASYYNCRFLDMVDVRAPDVTFVNCRFEGPSAAVSGPIVRATHERVQNLVLEDCTIRPRAVNDKTHCFYGWRFTMRRVDSSGGIDCVSIVAPAGETRASARIEASWLHDMAFFSPTMTQPENATHNDLVEIHGLWDVEIDGSRLEAFVDPSIGNASVPPTGTWPHGHLGGNPYYPHMWGLSGVMCAAGDGTSMGDISVRRSWIDGGQVGVNFAAATPERMPDCGEVVGNWFGSDYGRGPDYGVLARNAQKLTLAGNHRWNPSDPLDTSVPFNVRKAS